MRRLLLLPVLLLTTIGCEWPWRASTLTLTADLWTERIHGDLRLSGISGMLFDCRTHAGCVSAVKQALEVPRSVPDTDEVSGDVGTRLVQLGAESVVLELQRSRDGVDLVARFSAPAHSKLFRDELGIYLQTTGDPLLRLNRWTVTSPARLSSRPGPHSTTEVLLHNAPPRLTLTGPGNPDAVPLLLWLPGLEPILNREALLK